MTKIKEQMKLLKDAGHGVTESCKKISESFISYSLPSSYKNLKKFYDGSKNDSKKMTNRKGDK